MKTRTAIAGGHAGLSADGLPDRGPSGLTDLQDADRARSRSSVRSCGRGPHDRCRQTRLGHDVVEQGLRVAHEVRKCGIGSDVRPLARIGREIEHDALAGGAMPDAFAVADADHRPVEAGFTEDRSLCVRLGRAVENRRQIVAVELKIGVGNPRHAENRRSEVETLHRGGKAPPAGDAGPGTEGRNLGEIVERDPRDFADEAAVILVVAVVGSEPDECVSEIDRCHDVMHRVVDLPDKGTFRRPCFVQFLDGERMRVPRLIAPWREDILIEECIAERAGERFIHLQTVVGDGLIFRPVHRSIRLGWIEWRMRAGERDDGEERARMVSLPQEFDGVARDPIGRVVFSGVGKTHGAYRIGPIVSAAAGSQPVTVIVAGPGPISRAEMLAETTDLKSVVSLDRREMHFAEERGLVSGVFHGARNRPAARLDGQAVFDVGDAMCEKPRQERTARRNADGVAAVRIVENDALRCQGVEERRI